jgi:2-polyprenyl-3-methyl-5-hydroxy-6-metoxy-1,4-benzoquinol methylase
VTLRQPATRHDADQRGSQRTPNRREYAHQSLGDRFELALSHYDTRRRIDVLIDEFLPAAAVTGKTALDVGCGLGFFSERLVQRGAIVTACDIGPELVRRTRERVGCTAIVADALALEERFGPDSFDLVVSSECIEHTPDPDAALRQMMAVLRPGGYLSVSTPNVCWWPVVRIATMIGARPFDALENFSSWRSIRRTITGAGGTILEERGLHLFPFQLPLHSLSTWCDRHLQAVRGVMINICVLAQKLR